MLILALDTTSRAGSVALARDHLVLDHDAGDPALTHGERLPADIVRLLDRGGMTVADVDLFAVAAGPGSFTGLRVGIATIQGLALAHARPVVPVSALAALGHAVLRSSASGAQQADLIAVWMDAQRQEVFAALYRKAVSGEVADAPAAPAAVGEPDPAAPGLQVVEPPLVGRPETILAGWSDHLRGRTVSFVGEGALLYRDVLTRGLGEARIVEPTPRLAPEIALIAAARAAAGGAVAPHAIRPVYVRRPDAELARERSKPSAEP